jgi:hypothetical protein
MDETNRVLARLRRIEELREGASAGARAEGDAAACVAATKLREKAEGMR